MLRQNPTILEQLQTTGLVPAGTQLEAGDITNILSDYQDNDNGVLAEYVNLAPDDPSLMNIMRQAVGILQDDTSKRNVLFLIGHAGHWYLGEAFYDQYDDSKKLTLHDVRPENHSNPNQQYVIQTFAATAKQLRIETTPPHFNDPDDVIWNGYNCGDLVITRGMLCMGYRRDGGNDFLDKKDPAMLRRQVITEATLASGINIEFVDTPHGVAALDTQYPNYAQNKQTLIAPPAPASRQQQTSSSCTYADLQPILKKGEEIAKALGDANKQQAFVAANKAMNEILDSNAGQATFEESFDTMADAVEKGDEAAIEGIRTNLSSH